MNGEPTGAVPYDAPLESYERQAASLFAALEAHARAAEWRVKWEHPAFRGRDVAEVRAAPLTVDDIRDAIYHATPLGWAEHGRRERVADYLRAIGAPRA